MFYDIYVSLCEKEGKKPSVVAQELNINKSNVSNWKNNGYTPRGKVLNTIAEHFHVSTDYLLTGEEPEQKETPTLTKKDERDIAKKLNEMLGELGSSNDALMFDGEPLDDETRELLRASLQNQLEMTKRLAKQKFTPKKYRK